MEVIPSGLMFAVMCPQLAQLPQNPQIPQFPQIPQLPQSRFSPSRDGKDKGKGCSAGRTRWAPPMARNQRWLVEKKKRFEL